METFARFQAHLEAHDVDFSRTKVVVGPWLEMDAGTEQFVGPGSAVGCANALLRRAYRAPFVVPGNV